jgi:hypothetical protein
MYENVSKQWTQKLHNEKFHISYSSANVAAGRITWAEHTRIKAGIINLYQIFIRRSEDRRL